MRSKVLRPRIRLLARAAAAALLAGAAAGCSSDFSRFDAGLTSAGLKSYPEGVDQTATGSIGGNGAPVPLANVDARTLETDHAAAGAGAPVSDPYGTQQQASAAAWGSGGQSAAYSSSAIERRELPAANGAPNGGQRGYSAREAADPVRTGAIADGRSAEEARKTAAAKLAADERAAADAAKKVAARRSETVDEKGWTRTGGSAVTLREGETLYNLSKRYGVPVSAIMKANGIANADNVEAGQRVIIPNYIYSADAPISAPDANAKTQKAAAGRGWAAEKTQDVAALSKGANEEKADPRYQPKRRAQPPVLDHKVPDYSITTGAIENKSSDEAADAVRKIGALPEGVDPIVTGGADGKSAGRIGEGGREGAAPQASGISVFRWPVRGRIVSNFGDALVTGKNDGIDISVPEGTAVKAVENGVVVYSGSELEGLGNLVLIQHANGWVSAYAHNRDIDVKRGDQVLRGQVVARSGKSGNAETPKLHFELRRYSKPVDPVRYLDGA
jgi:murein DD-endopeptidase MepM/ murein hydrolase activator NlpD